jgi:hypothetical protein
MLPATLEAWEFQTARAPLREWFASAVRPLVHRAGGRRTKTTEEGKPRERGRSSSRMSCGDAQPLTERKGAATAKTETSGDGWRPEIFEGANSSSGMAQVSQGRFGGQPGGCPSARAAHRLKAAPPEATTCNAIVMCACLSEHVEYQANVEQCT